MDLIAVWGSSGAGKTTVALSLAAALVKKREDVLVLSSDSRTPALPVFLPNNTALSGQNSIGSLLEQSTISEAELKDRIHRHPKNDHLYFMGYASGELAAITYKPPQRDAVAGLLRQLEQSPFHHVIIDGDANPIYDPLTLFALEHARHVVRIVTPDVKGYEWQKAQLAWLGNSETFRAERHIKVTNAVISTTPLNAAKAVFGGFDHILPRARQVADKMAAGELLSNFNMRDACGFERQITVLAARIMEEGVGNGDGQ